MLRISDLRSFSRGWKPLILLLLSLLGGTAVRGDCPPGDLNGDGRVDAADLAVFARHWLTLAPTPADLNGDGRVDAADLALLGAHWQEKGCPIVINEVLAHSHAEASDWIELYNTGRIPVSIGGWFLSDNRKDLRRYEIAPGTMVAPHGYLVFYETLHFANPFDPGMHKAFAFSEDGQTAYLYSGTDATFPGFVVEQSFGASETGYPFGRYWTSTGRCDFVTMSTPTPGTANAYPRVGPVVINEVMYHPALGADAQYIELLNVSAAPVTLFDRVQAEPWRLTDDVNIDLRFPSDVPVTLPAGECLLVVRDPQAMRVYAVPLGTPMVAWGAGKLSHRGGTLRLLKPGEIDVTGTRCWIEVDRLDFSDGAHGDGFPHGLDPWPPDADGNGWSLTRRSSIRYGNDPNNWQAASPSPGSPNN